MRLPFLRRHDPKEPIRLPFSSTVNVGFGVYCKLRSESLPSPEALQECTLRWIEEFVEPPLRDAVRGYLDKGLLHFQCGSRDLLPEPPRELLCSLQPGEVEERRFQDATHLIVVTAVDYLVAPRFGLWAAVAASRALAAAYGGVILDPEMPRLLPEARHSQTIPRDGRIAVVEHLLVPCSVNKRGLAWITTVGMGRFGLPELEVCDFSPALADSVCKLVNGVAEHLVITAMQAVSRSEEPLSTLTLGPEITLRLRDLLLAYGSEETPEPEPGVQGWSTIRLEYRPSRKSSSFLRLVPPAHAKVQPSVWLSGVLQDLFGQSDTLRMVAQSSEAMEIAHRRALEELPHARQRFQNGLPPGTILAVKHGFPVDGDQREYMWVTVHRWQGERLHGELINQPQFRLDLRQGAAVELQSDEIYDWILIHDDGSTEGGYTDRVAQSEAEQ